jgi:hypothetical protein
MSVHTHAASRLPKRRIGKAMLAVYVLATGSCLLPRMVLAQEIPKGAVAYFPGTTCPAGWNEPEYPKGKAIVGTLDPKPIGTLGGGLRDQEVPLHRHRFATYIPVTPKPICGLCSCCNKEGASAYTYPTHSKMALYAVEGETDLASTNLPFIQFLACEKD